MSRGKNKITRANTPVNFLGIKSNLNILVWGIGGLFSLFPILYALVGYYILKKPNLLNILQDCLFGGELIWITVVFLLNTMGSYVLDLFKISKGNSLLLTVLLVLLAVILVGLGYSIYQDAKTHDERIPGLFSVVFSSFCVAVSVVLFCRARRVLE